MPVLTAARVVADSLATSNRSRLTTVEATFHRFVLAEANTHRAWSRNSASSRAIPVEKQLDKVITNPAWPLEWPAEQPGMQGGAFLESQDLADAQNLFTDAHTAVTTLVADYLDRHPEKSTRLHKSLVNRLLEPFMWHTVIISSTEAGWDNFFLQRCSPLAQPEIRVAANLIESAMEVSTPVPVEPGEWHTPYIRPEEYDELDLTTRVQVSIARCARVSYLTHDGIRDIDKDLELFWKLADARPPHHSPAEHCATPAARRRFRKTWTLGNFDGWHQARHIGVPLP